MLKLLQKARGHFLTLTDIRVQLIECNPGRGFLVMQKPCVSGKILFMSSLACLTLSRSPDSLSNLITST